jgi:cellulose synthase/poly-beta-1,6-N-acetylglucosamine synthase-like glycosyltransferase
MVTPDWLTTLMDFVSIALLVMFITSVTVISVLAGHLLTLAVLFLSRRTQGLAAERSTPVVQGNDNLPHVLIQLPTFNESSVVSRALEAAAALDWPRDRLHIQLLDDSTDETTVIAKAKVEELQARGVDAMLLHRDNRAGFKAGAMSEGLRGRTDDFVAIFDADFIPAPDYVRRTVGALLADPQLAFVQGRWEHLNANESLLTHTQSLTLDAHFAVEQAARSWSGLPMSFNGSGGIWRRAAIEDAGGWQYDTLTEDLDLSCRCLLRGWKSRFFTEVAVPGELPNRVTAWKNQQFRWTKGFAQTAIKLLPAIWRSPMPLSHKLAVTIQFWQGWVYPAGAFALLSGLASIAVTGHPRPELMVGLLSSGLGLVAVVSILCAAQATLGRALSIWRTLVAIMAVLALNSGLAISNSRAIWEALIRRPSAFERTPKRGDSKKAPSRKEGLLSGVPELLLAAGSVAVVITYDAWYSPFLALTVAGLTIVGGAAFSAARDRS